MAGKYTANTIFSCIVIWATLKLAGTLNSMNLKGKIIEKSWHGP